MHRHVDPHKRERDDITPEADGSRDDHATPEPKSSEWHDKDTPSLLRVTTTVLNMAMHTRLSLNMTTALTERVM
jgi:hypothetical protein